MGTNNEVVTGSGVSVNDPNPLISALNQIKDELKNSQRQISMEMESKLSDKITSEMQKINDNITDKLAPLTADVQVIKERLDTCEEDITEIKKEGEKEKKDIEKEKRKKNILIHGINVSSGPNQNKRAAELVVEILRTKLGVDLNLDHIDFTKTLGQRPSGPILMGLTSWNKKTEILSKSHKLKDTKIFIGQDFPPEVIATRKALLPIMKEHRKAGKHAIIKYDQLVVGKAGAASGSSKSSVEYPTDKNDIENMELSEEENQEGAATGKESNESSKRPLDESSPDHPLRKKKTKKMENTKKIKLNQNKSSPSNQGNLIDLFQKIENNKSQANQNLDESDTSENLPSQITK